MEYRDLSVSSLVLISVIFVSSLCVLCVKFLDLNTEHTKGRHKGHKKMEIKLK